jgi:hypothetical protein
MSEDIWDLSARGGRGFDIEVVECRARNKPRIEELIPFDGIGL